MKQILILTAVVIAISTLVAGGAPNADRLQRISQECMAQTRVNTQEGLNIMRMKCLPTTTEGKCFTGCLLDEFGLLDDCEFTEENCKEWARKAGEDMKKAEYLYATCHQAVGNGDNCCDTGPKLWNCMMKSDTEN